jgi:hypothetical protein
VLAVYWYCRARCWVLHSLYWELETVVLKPVGEAHLYRRVSVSELLCLHHPDILVAFGLADCANHSILRTRDARNPGERDAASYFPLPTFLTSNRST